LNARQSSDAGRSLLEWLEHEVSEPLRPLDEPARLRERLDALDRLELCRFDEHEQHRADAVRASFEIIDATLYQRLRDAIRRGEGAHALSPWLHAAGDADRTMAADGYDYLDEWLDGVLRIEQPDDTAIEQPPEMVFYQPTPARHIFDLIVRARLNADDVFVDLGSGLGHVPLTVAICSGARCIGIEREAAYADRFRRSAEALGLARASSVVADARTADLAAGTVFYLYTPFTGAVMRAVLDRLQGEARQREIRIATYGPCTSVVASEPWLEAMAAPDTGRIALFRSRG
jgi:hypothetical protein